MYVRRDDELGRLLAEVGQKAGLLDFARMRAAFLARHSVPEGATYACRITIQSEARKAYDAAAVRLDAGLPQRATHGGATIEVAALSAVGARYRLTLRIGGGALAGNAPPPLSERAALPLLSGVRITNQDGAAYRVENGSEANASEDGSTRWVTCSLEFIIDLAAPPTTVYLRIQSVLLADRQAFIATHAAARLIEGPWEFTIGIR